MTTGSLRVRLLLLAFVTIAAALVLTWFALSIVFRRHIEQYEDAELSQFIVWIAANIHPDKAGVTLREQPSDPRFMRPFGGLYWQVEQDGAVTARSRSLWDGKLPDPPVGQANEVSYSSIGPKGALLLLRAEQLSFQTVSGERSVRVIAAADYSEIEVPVESFGRDLAVALAVIGLLLVTAATIQVTVGLTPLRSVREEIAAVRSRRISRLSVQVPSEVLPLVEEANQLLAAQEAALQRARAQAGDLAHGLKTPLTILTAVADRLTHDGRHADSGEVHAQVQMMARRINRQLARARLAADLRTTTDLRALVERLVDLMRRSAPGDALQWDLDLVDCTVLADEVDLAEATGNVLDNACKWARTRIRVSAERGPTDAFITVEDDGPGVPEHRLSDILVRGTRLDSDVEGSGLGLAIVDDIVSAYHGRIELHRSNLGGLLVRLSWPDCREESTGPALPLWSAIQ